MGAAILTNDRDLTGTIVKLSISYPGAPAEQKPLTVRARVVSSAHTPGTTRYRHGLSFIRLPFDGRTELEKILRSASPDEAKRAEPAGVPEFGRVQWEEGKADFRTREVTPILNYHDRVMFRFRLSGNRELKFAKDYPSNEKLKQFLEEAGVTFTAHDMYNERGATEASKFIVACEVKASVLLHSERDLGKLLLRTTNVSGFGSLSQLIG